MEQLKLFGANATFKPDIYGYLPPIKKDAIYPERDYSFQFQKYSGELTQVEKAVHKSSLFSNQEAIDYEDGKDVLTADEAHKIRENLLVESVKSAFGESRGGRLRKPSDEAWEWIISEERDLPFSFERCCIACGLDPENMLDSLRYYRRKLLG